MPTDALPPIPTPASQRWREFRIQVLPVIMFVAVVAVLAIMWGSFVQPAGIIGEVQPIRANVVSLQDGILAELTVDLFDEVTKGQPIGRVLMRDEKAQNTVLKTLENDLMVMNQRMNLDVIRNQNNLAQLRATITEAQNALATAQYNLEYATREFERVERMFKEKLIPAGGELSYDTAARDKAIYTKEVELRTKLVTQLESDLAELERTGKLKTDGIATVIKEAIQAQQDMIQATEGPQILTAPIDGRVSMILRRAGERVVRGEPLVTISAPTSDRVIGYLRQPINTLPTTNDMVKVRTRSQKRLVAECKILHVGPSLEPISPALISTDSNHIENGLPILIGLPADFRLVPGEFVDLSIQYSKK